MLLYDWKKPAVALRGWRGLESILAGGVRGHRLLRGLSYSQGGFLGHNPLIGKETFCCRIAGRFWQNGCRMKESETLSRLSDICRRKHLALVTEKSYAAWVRSYIRAVQAMPGDWKSEQKVEAFLTRLAKRDVAAATQNQALNAVVFLYREVLGAPLGTVDALRVRRPATIRTALAVEEAGALAWFWVFPAPGFSDDPHSGLRRRHHLHEVNVSRELARAARLAGIEKRVTAHSLRHSYARTYC